MKSETDLSDSGDLFGSGDEVVAILEKKKAHNGVCAQWRVLLTDGEEFWVNEAFFTDLDGVVNPLFEAFETPSGADVTPQGKKRERERTVTEEEDDDESVKKRACDEIEKLRLHMQEQLTRLITIIDST